MMRADQPNRIVLAKPQFARAFLTEPGAVGRSDHRHDRINSKSLISYLYSL